MKTFLEYTRPKGIYVAAYVDEQTNSKLKKWAETSGFDLSVAYNGSNQNPFEFKFHTTIIYSENYIKLKSDMLSYKLTSKPSMFELLGESKDVPVLLVKSPELLTLRKQVEQLGLKDKWPTYRPHISLSYKKQPYDLSNLKLPDFNIVYDRIKVEDIQP